MKGSVSAFANGTTPGLPGFAREAADRVLMMDDGRIIEEGTPTHFFDAPREERTKQFLAAIL